MTKGAALFTFFSGFGWPGHVDTAVPEDAALPYLTYTPVFDAWDGGPVALTVNLWDRTESESAMNAKAQEISAAIGLGGKLLACDGGYIWLRRGTPFAQPVLNAEDPTIKRRYINITAEYLTKD